MPLFLQTNANPGTAYWGAPPAGGLTYWSEDGSGNLYPNTDASQDLGLSTQRIQDVWAGGKIAIQRGTGSTVYGASTGFVLGEFTNTPQPNAFVSATGGGIALGYVERGDLAYTTCQVIAAGSNSVAAGAAYGPDTSGNIFATNFSGLQAFGVGALALGRSDGDVGVNGVFGGNPLNPVESSWALGQATGAAAGFGCEVEASAGGAFASGVVGPQDPTSGPAAGASYIRAQGAGSRAHGYANTSAGGSAGAGIRANGTGSLALGCVRGNSIQANSDGSIALGTTSGSGRITASGAGSFAGGNVPGTLRTQGTGALAWGYAVGYLNANGTGAVFLGYASATSNLQIRGTGNIVLGSCDNSAAFNLNSVGCVVIGSANAPGGTTFGGTANITLGRIGGTVTFPNTTVGNVFAGNTEGAVTVGANVDGAVLLGRVSGSGTTTVTGDGGIAGGNSNGGTISAASGSVALGRAEDTATLEATASGSFAMGYARTGGTLSASANGAIALGQPSLGCTIEATGSGSLAFGSLSYNSSIRAQNPGAFAGGSAPFGGGDITASASGSFAFGRADGGDVVASAESAFQLGIGTNDTALSLQVGQTGSDGVHIHGGSAPGAPANGDIWVANGNLYIHSGGVTRNASNIP